MIPFPKLYDLFINHNQRVFSVWAVRAFSRLDHTSAGAALAQAAEIRKYAESSDLIVDQGEVMARCGIFYYNICDFDQAKSLYSGALHKFHQKKDHLNQAYVCCMLYYLYCAINDPIETSIYAHRALTNFLACEQVLTLMPIEGRDPDCIYWDIAKDIAFNLMTEPDETRRLINEFFESKLSPSSKDAMWEIDDFLCQGKNEEVIQAIHLLLETTRQSFDPKETGEALVYAALTLGRLGDTPEAVRLLKSGVANFIAGSHEQAFALWMLALYQFRLNEQYSWAIKNIERALEYMVCLERDADRHHDPYRRVWYKTFRCGMQRVSANRNLLRSSRDSVAQLS